MASGLRPRPGMTTILNLAQSRIDCRQTDRCSEHALIRTLRRCPRPGHFITHLPAQTSRGLPFAAQSAHAKEAHLPAASRISDMVLEVRDIRNIVVPTEVGTHFCRGYRPEFILGPANGRTRGPV